MGSVEIFRERVEKQVESLEKRMKSLQLEIQLEQRERDKIIDDLEKQRDALIEETEKAKDLRKDVLEKLAYELQQVFGAQKEFRALIDANF